MNIALISPAKEAYSETFIQAHKAHLQGNIHYLYGGYVPTQSETEHFDARKLPFLNRWKQSLVVRLGWQAYENPSKYYFKKYLKTHKIQIILAEYGFTAAEMLPLAQELGLPMIVHFHGFDAYRIDLLRQYQPKYQKMFDYVDAVVVVSADMQAQLITLGCPPHKILLNPYGVNKSFLDIQPNYQSNQFLAVGRFVNKKAPYLTIWAFKTLYQKYPEAKLLMIGEGELLDTCQNLARQWGMGNAVTFLGSQSHEQVMSVMEQSFCFLQHSLTASNGDKEGTPVAILEASAATLPIVSTSHAGIKEAVLHQKTGFLVEEHDTNTMSAYMLQLYEDRNLVEKMGQEGRQHIKQHYSMHQHIQKLDEILIQTIKNNA